MKCQLTKIIHCVTRNLLAVERAITFHSQETTTKQAHHRYRCMSDCRCYRVTRWLRSVKIELLYTSIVMQKPRYHDKATVRYQHERTTSAQSVTTAWSALRPGIHTSPISACFAVASWLRIKRLLFCGYNCALCLMLFMQSWRDLWLRRVGVT